MKWINYHHLIYFKEIATQGSISKASETLMVGQPALSSQLKSLEEYLGVKLFERKNRRLILTEPGKIALEYANKINGLGQELIQLVENKVYTEQVNLSVGALDSIPKHLICDIVDLAHKKTGCFLSVVEGSPESLGRQLITHQIELVISDHEFQNDANTKVYSKKILRCPVYAYASPKYEKLKKNFPQSLNGQPCLVPTIHSKLRSEIEHYIHTNGLTPHFVGETQDTSLQKLLATKGDGLVFLPGFASKELVQGKKLVRIGKLAEVYAEYYLVYSKRIIENPAMDILLKQNFENMKLG